MADIAARVGISRAAVSLVLRGVGGTSEATKQRVLEAAAELGYRPDSLAAGLRRSRSRTLGVLFALRRPFEVEFVEHLYPLAGHLGYDLLLGPFTAGRRQDEAVDELLRYRCAGLIVVGPDLHARDLEPLAEEVAVVEVGRGVTRGLVDVIRNDDAVGTRQAVDHLVSLGHRDIAYVDGGENPGAQERRSGYRAAMQDHGLAEATRVVPGGYTEDEGARAAHGLLANQPPTAVIAANDLCAIGIIDIALRAGLQVPGQLSVVGYDDSRFGRIPGIDLTSVRQDIPRMAKQALKAVVDRLDRPTHKPKDLVVRPKLVVRSTTSHPSR
ncbi:LacI family DNA-binding transcriptional regulator [Actinoplanes sp. LDG1-06]|uniref:LacI family DNA-binding transcriptional regulator n=1 Tax=Paractinoplanes ovalisporus TaxID=2810368 RepID=A0ABS2AR84_9ACTN|nr:LacI family DNA-binding transcriptional regulator [Actinoplanes ovalisporus]MBM2622363.1 LacI family DNA-binding transcriptional regulator [Actinoplanes ovalisporus]